MENRSPRTSPQPEDSPGTRRIIQTARTLEAINVAARKGFRPLVKPVQPSDEIHRKIAVFQDPVTGEVTVSGDFRHKSRGTMVIDYMFYYPYTFPNPFAAYLLPKDLAVGEEVWLDDLIEDIVGTEWNQGDRSRLDEAPAIWNGTDFEVQIARPRDGDYFVG